MKPTKDKIIRATIDLLQRQGYNATGLNQIIRESGAPRGSLYHHFPGGKEELFAVAMDLLTDEFIGVAEDIARKAKTPLAIFKRLIERFIADLESSDYLECSSIAAVALESATNLPLLQKAALRLYEKELAFAKSRLCAHGWSEKGAAALGTMLISVLEGAIVLCKAYRNTGPLRRIYRECGILFKDKK